MKNIFDQLMPEARRHFERCRQRRSLKRGDLIYRMGDQPTGIYLLDQGLVGLIYHSNKGTDHLLRIFKTGQFFAHRSYFAREPHHATAQALEPSEISFLAHEDVERLITLEPAFLRSIIQFLAKELGAAEQHRVMVSEQDVLVRTAYSVALLKEMDPGHKWTRAEIASFCASTTPSVVRALAELEARGFLRQEGREIHILDRERLLQIEASQI